MVFVCTSAFFFHLEHLSNMAAFSEKILGRRACEWLWYRCSEAGCSRGQTRRGCGVFQAHLQSLEDMQERIMTSLKALPTAQAIAAPGNPAYSTQQLLGWYKWLIDKQLIQHLFMLKFKTHRPDAHALRFTRISSSWGDGKKCFKTLVTGCVLAARGLLKRSSTSRALNKNGLRTDSLVPHDSTVLWSKKSTRLKH